MKTIVTFIAGALLASGLMYFVVGRNNSQPAETAQQQQVQPPPPVTMPQATEVGSNPAGTPTPEPEPEPVAKSKPSPMPAARPATSASAAKKGSASSPPAKQQPASPQTPAPHQQEPQQTAQNTPPPSNPNGGPMIPYDPLRSSLPAPPEDKRPEPPKRVPKTVTIPAGTLLTVRVDQTLSTQHNKAGDSFPATLDQPVVVDGLVIAERGSKVEGRVVEADPGGRVSGLSQIQLELIRLNTSDGQRVKVTTESFTKQGEKETKKDVAKVGAAAGIGAAIGAIAGGGKGAAIGAAIGGAAGTGGVMATRGAAAQLPAETRVSFRLREPITITERLP